MVRRKSRKNFLPKWIFKFSEQVRSPNHDLTPLEQKVSINSTMIVILTGCYARYQFESPYETSYQWLIVLTDILSRTVSELSHLLVKFWKLRFFVETATENIVIGQVFLQWRIPIRSVPAFVKYCNYTCSRVSLLSFHTYGNRQIDVVILAWRRPYSTRAFWIVSDARLRTSPITMKVTNWRMNERADRQTDGRTNGKSF